MRIWIFSLALLAVGAASASAEVITHLPGPDKLVALTFDACESKSPAFYDSAIGDYLLARQIPFTIFVGGRFARHNQAALQDLAAHDFVELENHSLDHLNHMERLSDDEIRHQIAGAESVLELTTGRHSRFFRFPAGNYDARALAIAEQMGYRVVHWSFASGDPARSVTPAHLTEWVLSQTRAGSILIFHINGRGWSTAAALPAIVAALEQRGFRFTTLADALK